MSDNTSLFKNVVAGGFSGVCAIVVGQPLDIVKVRLQTQPKPSPGERPLYSGTFDCALKIIRNESFFGLYKGMLPPVVTMVPVMAASFVGFNLGKKLLQKSPDEALTATQLMVAGMISGAVRSPFVAPGDRIKVLLQVQADGMSDKLYNGPRDAVKALYRAGGISTFFRGMGSILVRDIPGLGVYYLSYTLIRRAIAPKGRENDLSPLEIIFAGGLAGVIGWIISLPADVMKSRLQAAPDGKYPHGMRSVFAEIMRREGAGALFKGSLPVVIRAFPANGALFLGYEAAMEFMNWIAPDL